MSLMCSCSSTIMSKGRKTVTPCTKMLPWPPKLRNQKKKTRVSHRCQIRRVTLKPHSHRATRKQLLTIKNCLRPPSVRFPSGLGDMATTSPCDSQKHFHDTQTDSSTAWLAFSNKSLMLYIIFTQINVCFSLYNKFVFQILVKKWH